MKCYKCGATLTRENVCLNCGTNVTFYKRAAYASNAYYNLGLAKAQVRDLSGALESLKTSITIDKNNISARNLLGLVYLELGDVVEALSQWVISKNMQPDENIANIYISQIQANQSRLETITGTIKKYNLSLRYAKEGNYDMAVIQLKKVLTTNPKLVKANQLLALLYIRDNDYSKARRCLNSVLKIDRNNTLANRYMQEIDSLLQEKRRTSPSGFMPKKRTVDEEKKPLSGNDIILPKSAYKKPSNGEITIVNILVGVVIGAALVWFLIIPARERGNNSEFNSTIEQYSAQLSDSNVEINSAQSALAAMTQEKERLEQQLAAVSGSDGNNKYLTALISAANSYIGNDNTKAAEYLTDIDDISSLTSADAKSLYNTLAGITMQNAAREFYSRGTTAYNQSDFTTAANYFVKAYKCDSTNADYAYYAAKSYSSLNSTTEAKQYYGYIVSDFSSSNYVTEAQAYVSSH